MFCHGIGYVVQPCLLNEYFPKLFAGQEIGPSIGPFSSHMEATAYTILRGWRPEGEFPATEGEV